MRKTREIIEYDYNMLKILYSQGLIKIAVLFFMLQLFLVYLDVNIYIVSIYCPLIYCYIKYSNHSIANHRKGVLKHLMVYIFIVLMSVFDTAYFFLSLIVVYYIGYTVLINLELRVQGAEFYDSCSQLISVYRIFITLAIGINILCIWELYFEDSSGVMLSRLLFTEMLVVNILFSMAVLFLLDRDQEQLRARKAHSQFSKLAIEILFFFKTSELYFNPDFNIKDLAAILNVKKEDISQVINREYKMNFSALVAKYRIDYAKQKLLAAEDNLDLRSLIAQCGFNSHSVFYKYFREFEGIEPEEYKNRHFVPKNESIEF